MGRSSHLQEGEDVIDTESRRLPFAIDHGPAFRASSSKVSETNHSLFEALAPPRSCGCGEHAREGLRRPQSKPRLQGLPTIPAR